MPWAVVMASHVVSFRFSYRAGGAMAFRLVPRLVAASRSYWRPASRLVPPSRVGVLCCRASRVGVYPVAPFLSARVPVVSRLFSSLSSLLFVFVQSCVSDGVWSLWRCGVAWRCDMCGDMRYVAAGCAVRDEGAGRGRDAW